MARRPILRFAVLLAALSLLLPLALEASCADCLGSESADCCAPSCCPCCLHAPVMTGVARMQAGLAEAGLAGSPVEARTLPSNPCAVFHVPKPV